MRKHLPILIVLLASIIVHFLYFGYPRETVFDEVHFGKFVSGYFTHEYFFDIHPPLGKLIISGAGYVAGFQPGFSFGNIGEKFPDTTYQALRLLPSIAGTLLPVVIFLLVLELGMSRTAAFAAGMLVVFENALLVQSRLILLDAFLLLFGFAAWLCYARYRNTQKIWYLAGAAVLAGLSVSVKWTGVTFLGIIGLLELIILIKERSFLRIRNLLFLIIIPFSLYYVLFTIHFSLLSRPGPGDAFMKPTFHSESTFQKFIELNAEMYRSNARLTATHPYSSKWYQWPLMTRGIYYWNDGNARIYLLGNPVVWWASTFGILYVLLSTLASGKFSQKILLLFSGAYLINLLPFIGITRAMFLYHYFIGLIIAIIALVYLIDQLKNRRMVFAGLLLASFAAFVFFAPLSYGTSLSNDQFHARLWLKSWE